VKENHMKKTLLLAATMAAHFAAFQAKAAVVPYEKREEPTLRGVTEALDKINTAFTEYRKTNDERIEAIKAGKSTADLDAKLAKMDAALDSLSEQKSRLEKVETKLARPGAFAGGDREQRESQEETEYKEALYDWIRSPRDFAREQRMQQTFQALEAKGSNGPGERRATQATVGSNAAGGYALPEVIERTIARLSADISPIRQLATVRTVGSTDYKELFDIGGAGFEWVGETDTRNQTDTPNLVEVAPTFGMASAKPQASEESLDDLFFNVEDWLTSSASESMAVGEGVAFIRGDGVKKPTGILGGPAPVATPDATRAFGTLQFIASGQAAALPTNPEVFMDMVYALRARYRNNADPGRPAQVQGRRRPLPVAAGADRRPAGDLPGVRHHRSRGYASAGRQRVPAGVRRLQGRLSDLRSRWHAHHPRRDHHAGLRQVLRAQARGRQAAQHPGDQAAEDRGVTHPRGLLRRPLFILEQQ